MCDEGRLWMYLFSSQPLEEHSELLLAATLTIADLSTKVSTFEATRLHEQIQP